MMSESSDGGLWMTEDAALELLGLSRGAGREVTSLLRPKKEGIFREEDIIEGALLVSARPRLGRSAESASTWTALRGEGVVADLVGLALSVHEADRLELVIDELTRTITGALNDEQLLVAVRPGRRERRLTIVDVTGELRAVREGFRRRAKRGLVPDRRRGRPRKTGEVHALPSATAGQN